MRIHKITRRNFMKVAGVSALAMGLAACGGSSSSTAASVHLHRRICFHCCRRRGHR